MLADVAAVAVDFDRTITDERLVPEPEALAALARARSAGLRVIVVSGRTIRHLDREIPDVADAVVAENGCLVRVGHGPARSLGVLPSRARKVATDMGSEIEEGEGLVSVAIEGLARLQEALRSEPVALVPNKDRLMVVPEGIDKGTGLSHALRALRIPSSRAIAFGDAENDVAMFRVVGASVAVANAVEALKIVAHHHAELPGGRGVARFLEQRVLAPKPAAEASA